MKQTHIAIAVLAVVIFVAIGGFIALYGGIDLSIKGFGLAIGKPKVNIDYGAQAPLYTYKGPPSGACRIIDNKACPGMNLLVVNGKPLNGPGSCIHPSDAVTYGIRYCRTD